MNIDTISMSVKVKQMLLLFALVVALVAVSVSLTNGSTLLQQENAPALSVEESDSAPEMAGRIKCEATYAVASADDSAKKNTLSKTVRDSAGVEVAAKSQEQCGYAWSD